MTSVAGGTETRSFDERVDADGPASYLLAIDNMSSRRIDVPTDGILHLGRSPDADIQINSEAVSRNHAKLIFTGGVAQISDLGSHNGTLVNGMRVEGTLALAPGDVVAIADTLLILRAATKAQAAQAISLDQMCARIDQEIARATEYDRPFSVAVVGFETTVSPRSVAAAALAAVRPMDSVCVHGNSVIALMPELDPESGTARARELLVALAGGSRCGLANHPSDGCDTVTLLAAARSAVAIAKPGQLVAASSASVEHLVGTNRIVVADAAMIKLFDLIRRLARSDISVLVTGETGSGKENAAAALHHWSSRASGPLIALNCAALPEALAESELFGYERGAFSDAKTAKPGLLERAHGGTVFLDEVGDLSAALQAKLLRAIEQKKITRLGDVREREVDVRIVSATNIDLEVAVATNRFRRDLLFRLNGATVAIPPLRHRRQEIPLLARAFLAMEAQRLGRTGFGVAEATLTELSRYDWPGNVRELKNAIDFAVATSDGPLVQPWDLPARVLGAAVAEEKAAAPSKSPRQFRPVIEELRDLERQRITEALDACDGVQTRAAAAIGMPLRTFTFRMRQYGIESRKR